MLVVLKQLIICACIYLWMPHPFYLSVTEIKYNAAHKTTEVACKMFTNDLEDAIKRSSGKKVDLINSTDKTETGRQLSEYITKRLQINFNGKIRTLTYIGYEKEEDAIWTYFEIKNCEEPKIALIENKLLYDYLKEQINIVHLNIGNFKESSKVTNPEAKLEFKIN